MKPGASGGSPSLYPDPIQRSRLHLISGRPDGQSRRFRKQRIWAPDAARRSCRRPVHRPGSRLVIQEPRITGQAAALAARQSPLCTAPRFHSVCPASRNYVRLCLAKSLASRHASPSAANVLSLLCLRRAFQGGSPSAENPGGMGQPYDRLPGVERSNDWITHVRQTGSVANRKRNRRD